MFSFAPAAGRFCRAFGRLPTMICCGDPATAVKLREICAMVSLEMLQAIFNARFELLGVNEAMIELRAGL